MEWTIHDLDGSTFHSETATSRLNQCTKRIDKINGKQTLDAAGIKQGDWLLLCPHTLAGTTVKQNMCKIPHPKHELARKPILHEEPKAMTHVVHETETSVLEILVGESTN